MERSESTPSFQSDTFRAVLGHYPTGVAVVSAISEAGELVGMVVGSFTSVALDPPLIAFAADKNSTSYAGLRGIKHFVVNVLSAEQEYLCRKLSAKNATDKWDSVEWTAVASGAPRLEGAVAWIACELYSAVDAGDHELVIGAVKDLSVTNPTLPLLFFQGGYGRFTPSSLVIQTDADLLGPIRIAELARPHMEQLASELGLECIAQTTLGGDLISIASSGKSRLQESPKRVGRRIPNIPPMGAMFVAWASPEEREEWLRRSPVHLDRELRAGLLDGLERSRERGYSVVLQSPAFQELRAASEPFTARQFTPAQERDLLRVLVSLGDLFEPDDRKLQGDAAVRMISAPVFGRTGKVELALQIWDLPPELSEDDIRAYASRLKEAAGTVTELLAAADQDPQD
jgi:flavin reductase (DIM6/NTAB) family NADH-FMN oxidoreductase RutF